MLDHDHIDGSTERRRIDRVPCFGNRSRDRTYVLHVSGATCVLTRSFLVLQEFILRDSAGVKRLGEDDNIISE